MFFFIFAYSFLNLGKLKWFEPGKNSQKTKLYFPKGHPNAPFPTHPFRSINHIAIAWMPSKISLYHRYIPFIYKGSDDRYRKQQPRSIHKKKRIVYRNRLTPDASNDVAHKIVLIICRGQMQSIRDYGKKNKSSSDRITWNFFL